jgi:hypothetical protein
MIPKKLEMKYAGQSEWRIHEAGQPVFIAENLSQEWAAEIVRRYNAYEDLREEAVQKESLIAELEFIDAHLFKNPDTQKTREFITEDNPSTKRILRICDLIDQREGLLAACDSAKAFLELHQFDGFPTHTKLRLAIASVEAK